MGNVKISIITSTLNCENTIQRLAESLKSQTSQDFEWIVQDGGSNDKTIERILSIYPKAKVAVQRDNSVYDAWNKALCRAKGTFVLFLGGDDFFLSDEIIEVITPKLKNNKNIYYGGMYLFNEDTNSYYSYRSITPQQYLNSFDLPIHAFPPAPATLVPRNELKTHFDENYKFHADADMYYRLLCEGLVFKHLDIDISAMGDNGLTSNSETKYYRQLEKFHILRKFRSKFQKMGLAKISLYHIWKEKIKNILRLLVIKYMLNR